MKLDEVPLQQLIRQEDAPYSRRTGGLSRTISLRQTGKYMRTHLLLGLLAATFLGGLLAGALLVRGAGDQTLDTLRTVLGGYLEQRQLQSFAVMAAATFGALFVALLVLFFCGFCTIAQPLIFLVLAYKGLGYGFTIGMLYQQYGSAALPFEVCLQLPILFGSGLLLLYASKTAFILSMRLLRSTAAQGDQVERFRMRNYCIKYSIYLLFCLLISLVDAGLFCKFGGLLLQF